MQHSPTTTYVSVRRLGCSLAVTWQTRQELRVVIPTMSTYYHTPFIESNAFLLPHHRPNKWWVIVKRNPWNKLRWVLMKLINFTFITPQIHINAFIVINRTHIGEVIETQFVMLSWWCIIKVYPYHVHSKKIANGIGILFKDKKTFQWWTIVVIVPYFGISLT